MTRWKYFSEHELACKCGCGRADMDEETMQLVVEVREELGFPFRLNSAFRCPDHNKNVSSTGRFGPHTTGKALDISAIGSESKLRLVEAFQKRGFRRFGIAKNFVHIDFLKKEDGFPEGIWSY